MVLFRLLMATALILIAANSARGEESSALADCRNALQRGDFVGAIPICKMAQATAKTAEDMAMAGVLISQAQSALATARDRQQRQRTFDDQMVIDPDSKMPPFSGRKTYDTDPSIVIAPWQYPGEQGI
jgi:hypothetical protein